MYIEYNDMDGNVFNVKVYGDANFASYIIQHELDHLQGKLINGFIILMMRFLPDKK